MGGGLQLNTIKPVQIVKAPIKCGGAGYFLKESLGKYYVSLCALTIILLTVAMISFITVKGLSSFTGDSPISIRQFLFTADWQPDVDISGGMPRFGALVFILGSVAVSVLAVLLSTPIAISCSVFIAEISPSLGERYLRPALELFAGIPSVVYGWVGLSVLVPFIRSHIGGLGFSLLAGGIVLALMILPTITTLSADALKALPGCYKEASCGLGATRWQTISGILLPAAKARLGVGVTLGLARAFGEALAVQMVIGNSVRLPQSLLDTTNTLTSIITMDMGNTMMGTPWNNALWSMAFLLLLITFAFILIIKLMSMRGAARGVTR